MLEFGQFPDYLVGLYSEFSPVDLTAEGIVKVAQYAGEQTVFHVYSNRPIYHDRMLEVLGELGIHIENDFTMWFLKQSGFVWRETDFTYLQGYVEYFRRLGFLEV